MSSGRNSGWTIEFDEGFLEDLKKLGKLEQKRIRQFIERLEAECAHPTQRAPHSERCAIESQPERSMEVPGWQLPPALPDKPRR